jgi:CDP-diacylglycerol--glycerol-3-phosphate 3-phosphatidyltransferase
MTDQTGSAEHPSDAVLTVPNLITFVRLALLPVFIWLALGPHRIGPAFALGAFIGATDFFDGLAARKLHQVSKLGTTLDPLFDRIVVATAAVVLLGLHLVPWTAMVVVLARDVVLVVVGIYMQRKGLERPPVSWLGKWGSFGTMYSMGIFLASAIDARLRHPFRALAWSCYVPAVTFSYLAAIGYARTSVEALRARLHDG